MTPYPFQSKIIKEAREAVRDGYKKILICSPTGSGKTVIFSFITKYAEAKGKKILIGVHREKIVRQILKTLYKLGVQAGQIVSGKSMTKDYVQVGMVLTIKNRLHLLKHFDIIIFDECHHAAAKTYMDILAYFPDVLHIGVTATPWRLDNIGLGEIYQKMLLGPPTSWHVEKKLLKYPVMKRAPKQVTEKFKTVGKDFDKKAQKKAFTEKTIVGNVIAHYRKYLNYKPTICFCCNIDHANAMADVFIGAGIIAVAVHSKMKDSDVNAAFDGLENGSIHILTSCDKIGEGIDIPKVVGAILLRKTKSLSLYLQWCGRPLRLYPGEDTAYILDHAGNAELHGHILDARDWSLHSENVTERKKKLPTTTHCPRCMGLLPGTPRKCPECGYDLTKKENDKKQKMPKEIEGELIDFFPKNFDPNKIKELTGDILKIQKMSPKTRQKYLIRRAFELQNREEIAALTKAVGYKKDWTRYVWTNILKNRW